VLLVLITPTVFFYLTTPPNLGGAKRKRKMKTWVVIRIVKEVYEVEAETKEQAKEQAAISGDTNAIYVVSETTKLKTP
jgi:hypothetical protein